MSTTIQVIQHQRPVASDRLGEDLLGDAALADDAMVSRSALHHTIKSCHAVDRPDATTTATQGSDSSSEADAVQAGQISIRASEMCAGSVRGDSDGEGTGGRPWHQTGDDTSSESLADENGCGRIESLETKDGGTLLAQQSDRPHVRKSLVREHGDGKGRSRGHQMGDDTPSEDLEDESGRGCIESLDTKDGSSLRVQQSDRPHDRKSLVREHGDGKGRSRGP